jgi:hypothetical protein
MTAGEQLLIYSSLSGVATAEAHFLAIEYGGGGPGEPILVGRNCVYELAYIGVERKVAEYRKPKTISCAFVSNPSLTMALIKRRPIKMSYNDDSKIKIKIKCQS